MAENNHVIRLRNLSKRFGESLVLSDVNLDIENGEFLTFLGPSGCGKTTILRIIAGLEEPTTGDVFLDGVRVNDVPAEKRKVNTVFQSYALFPHMTVRDNLAFGPKMAGANPRDTDRRVRESLELVDLGSMIDRMPSQLSGGQQQRVAIARAIINNPKALLLDEPLSALDARLRKRMQTSLKQLCRELGITFILVTHDQEEAFAMSDRVVVMDEGRIVQVGTPVQVYEEPVNLYVAGFVGETAILDGKAVSRTQGFLQAEVEGKPCVLHTKRTFSEGQPIKVVLRPEDILVESEIPDNDDHLWLPGEITETVYKGSTWDMLVELDCGKVVRVTEFFNEDDDRIWHKPGDRIFMSWYTGWEVVLPDE
ncbi:spermidine/putrescine ABC transporter ATP-binding protein PotA [Pseudodesulfovibrio tunisiensis]|uniref:spermidine/putrescine ABC transporter ATP-binding protein PotA n=1 Tax=Pseudodesulfovibrio tunisiensis TaxID=463192 RepID=UPI001FB4268F|nr:spermidine/putrescine ABC transporter ATP-binding protein PotA [Pseudodesulfovibrio tunisiensis]